MKTNPLVFGLAVLGGVLLIISGTRGPIGLYQLLLELLPMFIKDAFVQTIAAAVALFLIVMASLGGFTVIFGGYLVFKNHVRTGKLLIGLGAGVGIPWLLFILFTAAVTQGITAVIAQHSILGWIGIILSFVARSIAR